MYIFAFLLKYFMSELSISSVLLMAVACSHELMG